jgi:deoxycytidylate deaminase
MSEIASRRAETSVQQLSDQGHSEISRLIYPKNGGEVFVGFVGPIGTNLQPILDVFSAEFKKRDYRVSEIKLSEQIKSAQNMQDDKWKDDYTRILALQDAGTSLRRSFGGDILAKLACKEVASRRELDPVDSRPNRTVYFFNSLKHPDEAALFRTIYGHGFFLVAVHSSFENRLRRLKGKIETSKDRDKKAISLIEKDDKEDEVYGQNTRETFELADFYLQDNNGHDAPIKRFCDLIFGALYVTPSLDEYGMHLSAAAAQRSSDMSRQVGAAILDSHGDVLSIGCNEVPKAGGGSYWPHDEEEDVRDYKLGYDPNENEKKSKFKKLLQSLGDQGVTVNDTQLNKALVDSELKGITEFGRTVHAEMDAILSCARRGVSISQSSLFTTTFPCHNCARHIIASGISRVVYIEPYAKSAAYSLHNDSLRCAAIAPPETSHPSGNSRVEFEPFVGVAPRRFTDLFSMRHLTGRRIERKDKGKVLPQTLQHLKYLRLQLSTLSYIEREKLAVDHANESLIHNPIQDPPNTDLPEWNQGLGRLAKKDDVRELPFTSSESEDSVDQI